MEGIIRLFVETPDEVDARRIADRVARAVIHLGDLRQTRVARYWKISEYFEICLSFEETNSEEWYIEVARVLGTGWVTLGTEATWNFGEDRSFLIPSARWAHVELLTEPSDVLS